jgi:hypothetical protein
MVLRHCIVLLCMAGAASGQKPQEIVYAGMCDASAAIALTSDLLAVADDEDNAIRVYKAGQGGFPVRSHELSKFLSVDPKKPESDIEAACRVGDRIYWITSHGQNQEGEYRSSRHAFFAMTTDATGGLQPVGHPYHNLLSDLIREPRLARFRLGEGSLLPPKSRGAVNIEGLCATRAGHLLIGFRNPIPQGRALVVPIENPEELLFGKTPRFGAPLQLNLDGLGIRDIAPVGDEYIILAGSYDGSGKTRMYRWRGGDAQPQALRGIDLGTINGEALITYPNADNLLEVLSDDGTRKVNGIPCKKLTLPADRRFRSVRISLAQQ